MQSCPGCGPSNARVGSTFIDEGSAVRVDPGACFRGRARAPRSQRRILAILVEVRVERCAQLVIADSKRFRPAARHPRTLSRIALSCQRSLRLGMGLDDELEDRDQIGWDSSRSSAVLTLSAPSRASESRAIPHASLRMEARQPRGTSSATRCACAYRASTSDTFEGHA
jgi:hypothetical protein